MNGQTVYQHEQHHTRIAKAVRKNQTQNGGVYTNELMKDTGLDRQVIARWLKANGFTKYGGHMSFYWRAEA